MAKESGLSLTSTTNVLKLLLEEHEILQTGEEKSTGGRKLKKYIRNDDYQHLGLLTLIKKNKQYIMTFKSVNLSNQLILENQLISKTGSLEEIKTLLIDSLKKDLLIETIIISIPGVSQSGLIDLCDYEDLQGIDMKNLLEKAIHKKIIIENDVNVASIGLLTEYPEIKHLAFLYQPDSDYVGCGLIINGILHNGFSHFAGELRTLPFYTEEDQQRLLNEDPKKLLMLQMNTLISVINPEVIGYCSDVFDTSVLLETRVNVKHLPMLIHVKDFDLMLEKGLFSIAIKNMKEGKL